MMRWYPLVYATMLFVVSVSLFPAALADDDSLKVVVVVEDKEYNVGTTGKVTVHVFDKGVHKDADSPPDVEISGYPSREISVSRVSEGVYQGTFTLQSEDYEYGYAMISATATLGKSNDEDTTYNEDSGYVSFLSPSSAGTGLNVRCYLKSVSDSVIRAGTRVVVAAEVTYDGKHVTADSLDLTISYEDEEGSDTTDYLDYNNPSKGIYESETFTIPDLSYSTDFDFEAEASYNDDDDSSSVYISYDHYTVVYHNVSKGATETAFDIYVAGGDGRPVKGAHVDLGYYSDWRYSRKWVDAGNTDEGGKVRATLTYPSGTTSLDIIGYANASGKSQRFSGTIPLLEQTGEPHPTTDEFEVVLAGPEKTYTPGQTFTREYAVFNDSKEWAGKTVYCYICSGSLAPTWFQNAPSSVEAKTLTTDASGRIKLTLTPPSGKKTYYWVEFESATGEHPKPDGWSDHDSLDGKYYSEDTDWFSAGIGTGGELKLTIESLKLGSPTKITATARPGDPPVATSGWGVGEMDFTGTGDPNWQVWSQINSLVTKSGSTYSGSVVIPSFMPKDMKYSIGIVVEGEEGLAYGFTTLKPGEGTGGPAAGAAAPMLYIGLVLVAIIIVCAVAVVAIKKRKAKPAPETVPVPTQVAPGAPTPAAWQSPPAAPAPGPSPPPAQPQPSFQPAPRPSFQQPPAPQTYQQPYQPQPPAAYPPPAPQAPPGYFYPYAQAPPAYAPPAQYPQQPQTAPPPAYYQQVPPVQPAQIPPAQPQPAVVGAAQPQPPAAPQGARVVTLPNNTLCAFCNQWMMQGTRGLLCSCGKCYHERCAEMIESCVSCKTRLAP